MVTIIPGFWGDMSQVDAGLRYFESLAQRWPDVELVKTNWSVFLSVGVASGRAEGL